MKITATATATEPGSRQHLPSHPWATCGAHNMALIKLNGSTAGAGEDRPSTGYLLAIQRLWQLWSAINSKRVASVGRDQAQYCSSESISINHTIKPFHPLPICLSRSAAIGGIIHGRILIVTKRLVNQTTFRCVTVTSHWTDRWSTIADCRSTIDDRRRQHY